VKEVQLGVWIDNHQPIRLCHLRGDFRQVLGACHTNRDWKAKLRPHAAPDSPGNFGGREIKTQRRSQSAGAQSALGRKPADERVFRPALRHLADRVGTRLRAKSRPGRTVTVRVRFADLHSVTRSVTLDTPISATAILAEIAEELVRMVLTDHPNETTISLLAISVSHLEKNWDVQLELPLGLEEEERRPGSKRGMARWTADRGLT
jgi:DNA polymerase-4